MKSNVTLAFIFCADFVRYSFNYDTWFVYVLEYIVGFTSKL